MAFVVQNDQGTQAGANAYISAAFFTAYHTDQGTMPSGPPSDSAIEAAIVRATRYMDGRWKWVGEGRLQSEQTTAWPRVGAYDDSRNYVDGVPLEVKNACAEYALIELTQRLNPTPARDESGQSIFSKSETVGPVSQSITFQAGAAGKFRQPVYPAADGILRARGLITNVRRAVRG